LGNGRTAKAIAAGGSHTCAILDNDKVRCWGQGGHLGYGNADDIGDNETPASAGYVDFGPGLTAKAITAGEGHTCVILSNNKVRCWGTNAEGQLGYGDTVGRNTATVGHVDLGGVDATRINAGDSHTCAILSGGTVRCWGAGGDGQLGLGSTADIGDDETPGDVAPVDLGGRGSAAGIAAGEFHTCAAFHTTGGVLCWGSGRLGALGRGNGFTEDIGDDEAPGPQSDILLGGPVKTTSGSPDIDLQLPRGPQEPL
jgi:alpha-tubulin suppressor-like RCC1 family protein